MKILELRIKVPDSVNTLSLNELGEEMQQVLPMNLEQDGMKVHDVTFEVKQTLPKQQTITVALDLKPGQKPYQLFESSGRRLGYQALRHFFEDIGYKVLKIAAILVFCAVGTFGQKEAGVSLPDAPKPKMLPHIMLTAAAVTFNQLDVYNTRIWVADLHQEEANPLWRPFVHNNSIYAEQLGVQVGLAYIGWKMHSSRHRVFRLTWWIPQTIQVAGSIRGWRAEVNAINNRRALLKSNH
jgi:hypothetical protein